MESLETAGRKTTQTAGWCVFNLDLSLDSARTLGVGSWELGVDEAPLFGAQPIVHGNKRVSVVFPAYNEEPYIRSAIEDFLIPGVVDEVLVVDNNSRDRTAAVAADEGDVVAGISEERPQFLCVFDFQHVHARLGEAADGSAKQRAAEENSFHAVRIWH